MVDRDLIKAEIDQVEETYLELLYRIIKTMTPAEISKAEQLPPHLRQRQIQLVTQAHQLRAHLGDPIKGLVELLSTLPPETDEFWLQVIETTPCSYSGPRLAASRIV